MTEPHLQAVIFDLDGTLADTRLDFAAMRRELGAPADMGLLEHVERLPSPETRAAAMAVIHRHEIAGAEEARWLPGAEAVVHELYGQGTPIGIVTRNSRYAAGLTMERLRMPPMPLKAREDAAPKPDPEALLALAAQWRIDPARCAYIGDFRYDIEAAQRAGMMPVLYLGSGASPPATAGDVRLLTDFRRVHDWVAGPATAGDTAARSPSITGREEMKPR